MRRPTTHSAGWERQSYWRCGTRRKNRTRRFERSWPMIRSWRKSANCAKENKPVDPEFPQNVDECVFPLLAGESDQRQSAQRDSAERRTDAGASVAAAARAEIVTRSMRITKKGGVGRAAPLIEMPRENPSLPSATKQHLFIRLPPNPTSCHTDARLPRNRAYSGRRKPASAVTSAKASRRAWLSKSASAIRSPKRSSPKPCWRAPKNSPTPRCRKSSSPVRSRRASGQSPVSAFCPLHWPDPRTDDIRPPSFLD